nr:DUF2235 domain-containing protein [uncultured Pedobacter sp.]
MNEAKNKRIVICCDGTWNEPGKTDKGFRVKTNVQKTFESICNIGKDGVMQIKYYTDGVGTSGSKLRRLIDGATGFGLDENILNAYKFLVWNYLPGDEIYFFGFSRGAYTARSIAGLIRNCGIIRNDDLTLAKTAYTHYRSRNEGWAPSGKKATDFRKQNSHETNIKFIGVWDTVGSLGIPFSIFNLYNHRKYRFHDTDLSSYVDNAFQALAIDEHRMSFEPAIWIQQGNSLQKNPLQILEQRWFPGVHSNIGGGYPDAGISDIAFRWMVNHAKKTGLAFDENMLSRTILEDPENGVLYDSLGFWFKLLPKVRRELSRLPQYYQRVDASAFYRWHKDADYRPENLNRVIDELSSDAADSYWC